MSNQQDEVLEKLRDAMTLLYEAREQAGIGTSVMIGSVIDELSGIIRRYDNINGSTENETPSDE